MLQNAIGGGGYADFDIKTETPILLYDRRMQRTRCIRWYMQSEHRRTESIDSVCSGHAASDGASICNLLSQKRLDASYCLHMQPTSGCWLHPTVLILKFLSINSEKNYEENKDFNLFIIIILSFGQLL